MATSRLIAAIDFGQQKLDEIATQSTLKTETSLPELIGNIVRTFIGLLGIIFLILIVYAGFLWLTAQGDDKKIEHAKSLLKNAVIGLIIISAAYAIASFVVNAAINVTSTGAQT